MTDDPIEKAADAIVELINSQPRSPRKEEIMDVLRLHHPHRPEGYLVSQEALDKAFGEGQFTWSTVVWPTGISTTSNSTNTLPLSSCIMTVTDNSAQETLSEAALERLISQLENFIDEGTLRQKVFNRCPNNPSGQHMLGPVYYDIYQDAHIQSCECGYKVILQK